MTGAKVKVCLVSRTGTRTIGTIELWDDMRGLRAFPPAVTIDGRRYVRTQDEYGALEYQEER